MVLFLADDDHRSQQKRNLHTEDKYGVTSWSITTEGLPINTEGLFITFMEMPDQVQVISIVRGSRFRPFV